MSETISRRKAVSLVGMAALAGPTTVALISSDATAQTPGMERREERRDERQERREERRDDLQGRGGEERRDNR